MLSALFSLLRLAEKCTFKQTVSQKDLIENISLPFLENTKFI